MRAIHLHSDAYQLLEAEARRRGVEPDQLAEALVREQVPDDGSYAGRMSTALAAAAAVRETLPPIDGRAAARAARDELERRGTPGG